MSGADWIAEKLQDGDRTEATPQDASVVFVRRKDKPDALIGVVPTTRGDPKPIITRATAKAVYDQNSDIAMLVAIPRDARWSGDAIRWLEQKGIAFGGVGDLMSAVNHDDDISTHRNKTFAFVDDGIRRHSRVKDVEWQSNKVLDVRLDNGKTVRVALEDAYDITMDVARQAGRLHGNFDVLLKTNPNGSISSNGADSIAMLGFQTLKWGELFQHLAKGG